MDKLNIKGFDITIENKIGSNRTGLDINGNVWSTIMKHPYGYFENTIGADGDELDVFVGEDLDIDFDIYVINQTVENSKTFDEHKVMFGFKNEGEAVKAYFENFDDEWEGFDNVVRFTLKEFTKWVESGGPKTKAINNIKMKAVNKIKKISLLGEVKTDSTLEDLKLQAGDLNEFSTIILDISSQGGCVEEGLKIMIWLNELSDQGKEVITVVSANAYSIASLIMLAADKRYISKHGEVMVHNPMVPFIEYANANELEKHISELRLLENLLQQLYVNFSNISAEDIKVLMDNETYLSPDDAVAKGFADSVIDVKPKPYSMMAVKNKLNMSKTKNMLNVVIAAVNGEKFVNQMYYNTAGDEIQIFQSNPAKYGIGDKTSMEEGEVRLSDGTKLSIKNFEIANIEKEVEVAPEVVAEEPVVEPVAEPVAEEVIEEAPVAPVAEEVIEETKPVAEFNEGPEPKEILAPVAKAVAPIEGEEPVVEPVAEVIIEPVVEPVAEEAPVAPVEEVIAAVEGEEPIIAPVAEPVAEEVIEEPVAEAKEWEEKYMELLSRVEKLEGQIVTNSEDLGLAAESIDALARNTSSAFKPEAKKVAKQDLSQSTVGMSLFQRMKAKKSQR